MPSSRKPPGPARGETALSETPHGRLQELDLRRLIGYQMAQATVVTLAIFDEVVGRPVGLRAVEYAVLALVDANGAVSPAQLAQALSLSPSYITMALDKLESRGLLRRQTNARDRRAQELHATTKGTDLVGSLTRNLLEAERRAFSTLTEAEQMMLAELLHKLARSRFSGSAPATAR